MQSISTTIFIQLIVSFWVGLHCFLSIEFTFLSDFFLYVKNAYFVAIRHTTTQYRLVNRELNIRKTKAKWEKKKWEKKKMPIRLINAIYTWVFINFYLLIKQFARLLFILPNVVVYNLPWQGNVHEKRKKTHNPHRHAFIFI